MITVKYFPCIFEEKSYEFESRNSSLATVLLSLMRRFPEIRKDSGNISIRVNGKLISPFGWARTSLKDGDKVFIIQEIGIIDWILEAWIAISAGLSLSTVTAAGLSAFTIAGISAATISTILSVVLVVACIAFSIYSMCNKPDAAKAIGASSPTYGWDGIRTNMGQGSPVPLIYGEHITGGTLIGIYVSTDGEKNYLNMLIALGEGEIGGIMKEDLSGLCASNADNPYIKIDNNFLSNYGAGNYWWDYRLGTQEQEIIPGWEDIKIVYEPGSPSLKGDNYIYTTVDSDVEAFELGIRYTQMVVYWHNRTYAETLNLRISHRIHGTAEWTDDGVFSVAGATMSPLRRRFRKDELAPNQYDIKIHFESMDPGYDSDAFLDNVTEIKYGAISYPFTAVVALKFLATEKMSGSTPNVLIRMRGLKIKNLETEVVEWSPNPIYAVNDAIVNERYGLGRFLSSVNIDTDQLIEEAQHCFEMVGDGTKRPADAVTATSLTCSSYTFVAGDIGRTICMVSPLDSTAYTSLLITSLTGDHQANGTAGWSDGIPTGSEWEFGEHRFELDLVVDSQDNAISQIQVMCASFRCAPLWTKNVVQLIIDRKKTPSYLFNMGNILEGAFQHTFGSEKEKPTVIEVDFANRDSYYQREVREVDNNEAFLANNPRRIRKLSLLGCTRPSQIFREGRYQLRAAQLQDQSIQFGAMIDAIHNLPGDLIKFQHDVNAWGKGGRIMAATINSITVDQEIQIEAGKTYVVTVRQPGATAGSEILETRTVNNAAGYTNLLTVSSNFSAVPQGFSLYAFGQSNVEAVPFTITKLTRTKDNQMQVEASLYDVNVHADTGIILPEPIYSQLPNPLKVLPVTNLTLTQGGNTLDDGSWSPWVEIGFVAPDDPIVVAWDHCEVYISISLDGFVTEATQFYGNCTQQNGYVIRSSWLVAGVTLRVRLVSVNKSNKKGDWSTSPYADITIAGNATAPANVSGFAVTQVADHLNFAWNAVTDPDVDHYEIREGASWAAGTEIAYRLYGLAFTLFDFTSGAKHYWIKAVNRSGIPSANAAGYLITVVGVDIGTTPSGLTVDSTFKYIILSWTNASSPNVQYTEIWRSDDNNRSHASLVGISDGTIFWDLIGTTGTTKYYWIRTKNLNGGNGPWLPSSPTGGVSATTAQLQTGDFADLSITNAKIANLAVDSAKIALLAVQSANIDNLTIHGVNVAYFMVSRGVQFYNAAGFSLSDANEHEIGTITFVTFEAADSIWLWASVAITQYGLSSGKGGGLPIPIHFRVRRDSISGPEVCGGTGLGFGAYASVVWNDPQPVILIGSDIPGGSPGNHVYKLTAQAAYAPDVQSAITAYRLMMGNAKSR